MADIIEKPASGGTGKGMRRAKRHSTKVDFTPMVDLGFLLITFFILTSQPQEPEEMRLLLPADGGDGTKLAKSTALTIIPIDNQKVFYYHGDFSESIATNSFGFTVYNEKSGIGKLIKDKKVALANSKKFKADDLMLIIKPTGKTTLGNIVDALDEVRINDLKHYAFVDIDPIEENFLKSKKMLQ